MRDVRQRILAITEYPMGSVEKPHPLHSLRANCQPMARQALYQPDQARSVTISLMLSAPDRVDSAGHPNNQ